MKHLGKFVSMLLCICLLMLTLAPAFAEQAIVYTPGTYTGIGYGHNGKIVIEMTFSADAITDIKVVEHSETPGICDVAMEKIPAAVLENQSLGVDTVSSATDSSNGILNAMEDCVKQAGADVDALKAVAVEKVDHSDTTVTLDCDVCVVGAGVSGSVAAIQAADLGAKVIIIEKAASTGVRGGSFFVVDSPLLKDVDCDPVDVGVFFKEFMEDTSWRADGTMVRDWLEMSKSTVSYMQSHGCEFFKTLETYSGGHSYAGGFGCTQFDETEFTATEQVANALHCIEENGGALYCETEAKELIVDENNRVSGVLAQQADGTVMRINAKSVILATGGYNADFDWVSESYNGVLPTSNFGLKTNLGDGILMARKIGAAEVGEQAVMLRMPRLLGDFNAYNDYESGDGKVKLGKRFWYAIPLLPMTLWVNSEGERFADEDEVCYNRNYTGNVVMSQGGYTYIVMTKEMLETLGEKGASSLGMTQPQGMGYINDYTLMDIGWGDVMMVADGLVEQGVAYKGDTIEELAEAAGMNPERLARTLAVYNEACANGKDETFYKNAQFLYPMEEGPYYMFTENVNVLTTLGGLKVSRYMEVESMDAENRSYNAIANLYACGTCTGGLYGDHYANAEGVAQSFCMTSARTAACYAVNNALNTNYNHLELSEATK